MQQALQLEGLKQATPVDWREVADITAEAFANDPVNKWTFGTERAVLSLYRTLAPLYLDSSYCYLADNKGAAMWLGPHAQLNMGLLFYLKILTGAMRFAESGVLTRTRSLHKKMEAHHPTEPHYYLFTIGARASARGQGIGRRLIAPMLAHADQQGMPVYLENSNPVNHGFYSSYGFEKITEFEVGTSGPPMAPMWRSPRAV